MISNIKTISLNGIDGNLVEVQTDITGGLPTFDILGNYYKIVKKLVFSRVL